MYTRKYKPEDEGPWMRRKVGGGKLLEFWYERKGAENKTSEKRRNIEMALKEEAELFVTQDVAIVVYWSD